MGNRIIDLRDPDDYIPFDEYEKHEQAYKMRLQAKANELQKYVDDTLVEKSPISVRYKETIHLGVVQPHILVNNNGQFYFFTDCDKAENKVKEMVDNIMNTNTSNTVKINESQLRKIITESVKKVLREGEFDTMDWDYAANPSNELEDTPTAQFNGEGFQKQVYDNDDRQEMLWAIKHFLTNDISADAVHIFERNEQLWQAAWDNVDAYLGSDKEEFIREAEQMKYSLPNGWTLDDVFNIVKTVKTGLQGSDTLAESKRTIKLNESQLRKIISKSVKKVLKEYELSDREKGIMRGYWGDVESRRMPKEKYEPYKPQSQKTNSSNIQKPKRWTYNNRQNK